MTIDWLRDLIIVIFGLVATVVLIFMAVLWYSLYRRARSILDSIQTTSRRVQGICSYASDEVIKPLIQVVTLIQGIRQGVKAGSKLFRKKEGGRDG